MTKEEAKTVFLNRGYVEVEGGTIYDANKWREACVVISDWLEQKPCEDCISRQAVMNSLCDECELFKNGEQTCFTKCEEYHFLATLPSVTPQEQKTGYWIKMPLIKTGQTYSHKCSLCGRKILATDVGLSEFPYCHCGAKMQAESEGRNDGRVLF